MAEASGEAKYKLPGKRQEVSASEFQMAVEEYGQKAEQAGLSKHVLPLVDGKGAYIGIRIYKCFGAYRSDEFCIKCPLRKNCITHKG